MSRFSDLVSKPARDMADYFAAAPQVRTGSQSQLIKLDSNENPFGPSRYAIKAMRSASPSSNFYPDDDCVELSRKLAAQHALSIDQVLVTAGSTEMIALLCQTMLAPGLNAVTSECSFLIYDMAVHAVGADLRKTPLRDDGFDLAAIRAAINEDTRIVFLANPNNPTGTMVEAATIDHFLAEVPAHVVVVLDEAYYEFAAHFSALRKVEYSRSLEYVRSGATVVGSDMVVLRSFSKAHGLAGLRIGYGLGPAELLAYCSRMRNVYSVSYLARVAALAALGDHDHILQAVSNNSSQAVFLTEELSKLGYRVIPTSSNFLCCDIGQDSSAIADRLRDQGVSVRALNGWGAPSSVRVTIGTPEQNDFFLRAIRKIRV